jgi:hypothetical protein
MAKPALGRGLGTLLAEPRREGITVPGTQSGRGVDLFLRSPADSDTKLVTADFGNRRPKPAGQGVSIPDFVQMMLALMDVVLAGLACWLALGSSMSGSLGAIAAAAVLLGCATVSGLLAVWTFRR